MIAAVVLVVTMPFSGAVAAPLSLDSPAAQKAALRCQRAITDGGARFLSSRLGALDACTTAALKCVQGGDPRCLAKLGRKCAANVTALPGAVDALASKLDKSCRDNNLRLADLLASDGLGLGALVDDCNQSFGIDVCTGVSALTRCVALQHERASESLLGSAVPRAHEVLSLVPGLPTPVPLPALPPFAGCGDCASTVPASVTACGTTVAKTSRKFAIAALSATEACLKALFACVQTKGSDAGCLTKARKSCGRSAAKVAKARTVLGTALEKKCGAAAVDFALLQLPAGLNLDALASECAALGAPPLDTVDALATCVRRNHECQLRDLVRGVVARGDELLLAPLVAGLDGGVDAVLDGSACATPTPAATPAPQVGRAAANIGNSVSIRRFITLVRRVTDGTSGIYQPGGSVVSSQGAPRRVSVSGGATRIVPGGTSRIRMFYERGGGPFARANGEIPTPPTLIVTVRRADVILEDHIELPLPAGTDDELDLTFADDLPGCVLEIAFATAEDGQVSDYTPLQEVLDATPTPTSTPIGPPSVAATPTPSPTVTPDVTRPTVIDTDPKAGHLAFDVTTVDLTFSEPLNPALVVASGFTLTDLGPDGNVGGGDDAPVTIAEVGVDQNHVTVSVQQPLPTGNYRLQVSPTVIADLAGNHLAATFTLLFASSPPPPLGTTVWTGDRTGDWSVKENWSGNVVPGANDRVVIDRLGDAFTITHSTGIDTVKSIQTSHALEITGGTLTITEPSLISGSLKVRGTLVVTGATASLSVTGTVTLVGANLTARNGGVLDLSAATQFIGSGFDVTLLAETNGVVDLSGLQSIVWNSNKLSITTRSGGRIDLSALATFDVVGNVVVSSTGPGGSEVDLRNATAIGSTGGTFTLSFANGGAIRLDAVTTFDGVVTTLDATSGQLPTQNLQSVHRSVIGVTGGTTTVMPPFTALTDADGSSFTASVGATLSLPSLTTYGGVGGSVSWQAITGGTLDLSALTLIDWNGQNGQKLTIAASSGGYVDLTGLQTFDVGGDVAVTSTGPGGSEVDLHNATAIGSTGATFTLSFANGGAIRLDAVTTFDGVVTTLDGAGLLPSAQLQTVHRSSIAVTGTGVAPPFTALTDANGSSFTASVGATLSLPSLTTYGGVGGSVSWQAVTGGTLDLSALTLIDWSGQNGQRLTIAASSGGHVDLTGLATFDVGGSVVVTSTGPGGSAVDLRNATAIGSTGSTFTLSFANGGAIRLDAVTTFDGVVTTLDGAGLLPSAQLQTVHRSSIAVTGTAVAPPFTALTDADGSSFTASVGSTLSLPNLTTYRGAGGNVSWQAISGGTLAIPALTVIDWNSQNGQTLSIHAATAGTVNLGNVQLLGNGGQIHVTSDGKVNNVPSLVDLGSVDPGHCPNATFTATNGGIIDCPCQ